MSQSTFSGPIRSKNGMEVDAIGNVSLGASASSDVTDTLAIVTEQVTEAIGTFTPSHKHKIKINGVEYWIQLDAV